MSIESHTKAPGANVHIEHLCCIEGCGKWGGFGDHGGDALVVLGALSAQAGEKKSWLIPDQEMGPSRGAGTRHGEGNQPSRHGFSF